MTLWNEWLHAVMVLRPACGRMRTFLWMILALMGLCCRSDNAGVTSFVRVLNFRGQAYHRLLHLFHSTALNLDVLTTCWTRLCIVLFRPFEVGSRLVCLADGIKAAKEGKRMPAVKKLHQQSSNNSKPEFIMGHSLQAVSLLVHAPGGQAAAVPLTSRVHEGVVFSNRDARSLLDKLVALLLSIARGWGRQVLLVADAYYASAKVIVPLLNAQHHLLTRAKSNVVAYMPVPKAASRARGRPRIYGQKVRLKELARDGREFKSAPSPVYGDSGVLVRYRTLDLMWRPVARLVRFVIVHHPARGTIFLLCTDLSLEPLQMLQLYGYRFKIELGFRQAVHVLGTYAYHFWMAGMKPVRRDSGQQYLHRASDTYRQAVRRKLRAYHVHVQLGCIAQGLLQHLALNHTDAVWVHFRSWLRTMNPAMPPSELIVASALRSSITTFFPVCALVPELGKIASTYYRQDLHSDIDQIDAMAA
ncbi:transposase [Azohydromonas australica]|uniref:transposase n=1 Tax=Azohydromonas australica TaxID=364039 RepID=UPI0012EB7477|nr:transposase [Azohydromonas australica]